MLPVITSAEDVDAIVSYLRPKATGAPFTEMRAALGRKLMDARKLAAYEFWGFVTRENDRLNLTEMGRRFGRASTQQKAEILGEVLRSVKAYRIALEWMFHQRLLTVSSADLASHWLHHIPKELGSETEDTIRSQVSSFFQLAQAAGLGTYTIGRRGTQTRFDVSRDALGQFIGQLGLAGAETEENDELPDGPGEIERAATTTSRLPSVPALLPQVDILLTADAVKADQAGVRPALNLIAVPEAIRVFISHSKNMEIVDQLRTMLEFASLDYEIAEEEETAAIPVPEKVLSAMRRCNAAVICVTADEEMRRDNGNYAINENILIEIGAAFVLYDKRVVLVWDRRIKVPSNLQGLYRCEFEGNELTWNASMKLMKAVNQFKKPATA